MAEQKELIARQLPNRLDPDLFRGLFVKSPNETQLIKQKNIFFDFFALLLKAVSTNETALELSKEEIRARGMCENCYPKQLLCQPFWGCTQQTLAWVPT